MPSESTIASTVSDPSFFQGSKVTMTCSLQGRENAHKRLFVRATRDSDSVGSKYSVVERAWPKRVRGGIKRASCPLETPRTSFLAVAFPGPGGGANTNLAAKVRTQQRHILIEAASRAPFARICACEKAKRNKKDLLRT